MRTLAASFLIAYGVLLTAAWGQSGTADAPQAACPPAAEVSHLHLYGVWRADFKGLPQGATLLFEKHPEYAESVRGGINRAGIQTLCAGDVDNGVFTLEESNDGHKITANWTGTVMEGSCGKEISGTWKSTSDLAEYPFVLRKQPGW